MIEVGNEKSKYQVNALGIVLKDDTALLLTITVYWDYYGRNDRVGEEYEHEAEGRILRHINYDFSSIYGGR